MSSIDNWFFQVGLLKSIWKSPSTTLPLHCSLITTLITAVTQNNSAVKSDVIKQWHSRFLYPTREPTENTQPHYIHCVPLPTCTVATRVTAMCQYYHAGIACDSNRISIIFTCISKFEFFGMSVVSSSFPTHQSAYLLTPYSLTGWLCCVPTKAMQFLGARTGFSKDQSHTYSRLSSITWR